jgi:hypothetical protein
MVEEKHSKIEDIKGHLYDPDDKLLSHHFEGELHKIKYKVPNEWEEDKKLKGIAEEDQMKKPKTSIFKIFFIGAIIFFIGALGFAFYKFSTGGVSVSNENIDIVVLGNAFTKGGEELPLQIEIVNRNKSSLELANMIISYPSGAGDNIADIVRLPRDSIGTIKAGESIIRNVKVKLFGEEKSIRDVVISLEYHPEGSNAIFTREQKYSVTISSAPLSLFIEAPEKMTSDQTFTLEVKTVLNTSLPEKEPTVLQMSYPNNFVFDSATPEPTFGNSVWSLSSLSITNPVSIIISGRLVGQEGDEQVFHAYAGTTNPNNQSVVEVVYNSLLHSVLIEKPFLEAKILVNNQDAPFYTASSSESISAEVSWINNLSTRITDAQIIVGLSGNSLDWNSIEANDGFYDSANNQIIWDKNMVSELESVEPGEEGSVSFKFKSISLIGLVNSLKDPQIVLNVSIRGRQPNLGSTFSDVNNFSKKIIKILSDFQIASSAYYSSGFLPPKAENETRYKVTWTLSNTSNTITGAQAKSLLPIYVDWVSSLTGGSEKISYNEVTREVTWDIGTVQPNTGFNSNREASFMIALKPSRSQIGSVPQLMKEIYLSGQDSFIGVPIKNRSQSITTMLLNDPAFKNDYQRVVQ